MHAMRNYSKDYASYSLVLMIIKKKQLKLMDDSHAQQRANACHQE